jgi:hypothetical protein
MAVSAGLAKGAFGAELCLQKRVDIQQKTGKCAARASNGVHALISPEYSNW